MSEHKVALFWENQAVDFVYETYDRTHRWELENGPILTGTAAPEYLGKPEFVNPEEAYCAALSSCHLLSFLAICAWGRYHVQSYEDHAVALLDKNEQGRLAITKVWLRPKVVFKGNKFPDREKLITLHEKSHKACFIANSVRSEVIVEPVFNDQLEG